MIRSQYEPASMKVMVNWNGCKVLRICWEEDPDWNLVLAGSRWDLDDEGIKTFW